MRVECTAASASSRRKRTTAVLIGPAFLFWALPAIALAQAGEGKGLEFPVRLAGDRVAWLDRLAKAGTPECLELLRQHLFDHEEAVREKAFAILEERNDPDTALVRFHRRTARPPMKKKELQAMTLSFLAAIEDPKVRRDTVLRALVDMDQRRVPGISRNDLEKLAGPLPPDLPIRFDLKSGTVSGARPGILTADRLGFVARASGREKGSGPSMCGGSPFEGGPAPGTLLSGKPMEGAWCRAFSQGATPAACREGKFFLGDGEGRLVAGDLETGAILWAVPFPCPPFAKVAAGAGEVLVAYPCRLDQVMKARFDPGTGELTGLELGAPDPDVPPAAQIGDATAACEPGGGGVRLVARRSGRELWRHGFDCAVAAMTADGADLFVLGEWRGGDGALACLDAETGAPRWAFPLQGGGGTLHPLGKRGVWLVDDESNVLGVSRETGEILADLRFAGAQYSPAAVAFLVDEKRGRLLMDPCNGMLYSLPLEPFLERFRLNPARNWNTSLERAFTRDVVVERLDLQIGSEKELFDRFANHPNETKFNFLTNENWFATWAAFEKKLVERAQKEGLGHESLQAALAAVRPRQEDETALVPVNAYRLTYKGEDAWVLVCKWESAKGPGGAGLGHVRMWAISVASAKVLGYVTCG